MTTLVDALETQALWLLRYAHQLDKRGYVLLLAGANKDTTAADYPFGYLNGMVMKFLEEWNAANKARCIVIAVAPAGYTTPLLDTPLTFGCAIPNRAWARPIHATLDILGQEQRQKIPGEQWSRRPPTAHTKLLEYEKRSDRYDYKGASPQALRAFLRVLDMPQHKKLLTGA